MRNRSETWANLAQGDFLMVAQLDVNGKLYSRITAPRVDRALMSNPLSVGNCTSATLEVSILTDDLLDATIPIVVKGRLMDPTRTVISEALPFGTFYINQRNSQAGLLTLQCYDVMLKANQPFLSGNEEEEAEEWPKPMADVVTEIAYRLGVGIDNRTQIIASDRYMVTRPEGLTMRQVLGYIGACMGGNWIVTEENLLRLVPMNTVPGVTSSIDKMEDAVTPESAINGYTYYVTDEAGRPIVTRDGFYIIWADDHYVPAETGLVEAKSVLGGYDLGTAITVTGVYMTDTEGNEFKAGDLSGPGVIRVEGNPYANQMICTDLYSRYQGLVYAPYEARQVIYDPAAELGDQIRVHDKISSVLYATTLNFDVLFTADISAPNNEELTAEYPYLTEIKRIVQTTAALRETIAKTNTELKALTESSDSNVRSLANAIRDEITRAQEAEQNLQTNIESEESRAQAAEEELRAYIDQKFAEIINGNEVAW